ncbi:hypothetical protein U5801_05285 [Lamprobacter modestohalophilus]|uniref:ABC transporter substrate-binding protein n=1 Tax=Lamprobacter modestohalophilus TaxID=1064514 RepID=A0A9X1B317_9GAMM|nr:hypothetical protein [Lamprobacter modestohalophilus]MCF7978315.1 hypothetical protein [Chromatiaceae bacterium]MBK1617940.1 hypothetical protein [Lamprobacter modestohalophilus]MCF7994496.1 hypothetical protein [Chromatiaceae bacterium]MCF8002674.1 hypothetical protein [Chromatiaceae bacterium]MEA1049220.1 hypothetical protein [Lamprobacter modestohalophilus]
MKQSPAALILSLLFFVGVAAFAVVFNVTKPRVMILQSYDPEYAWTRDINAGIRRVSDGWTNYSVNWHYMNTKRFSDPDSLRYAGIVARRAIERFDPNVLIAVDDLAQGLAASFFVDHPRMEIVFTGVNDTVEPYGYVGAENVTGVFERKPLQAVKDLVLTLEQETGQETGAAAAPGPGIHYLMDPSESMARDRDRVEAFDWSPVRFEGTFVAADYPSWQAYVRALPNRKGQYLLVANYRQLQRSETTPEPVPPDEVMRWTEANSPIPIIGVNVFNVEDGAALAVGASPFEQGEVAARLADQLLQQDVRGGQVPIETPEYYVVAINEAALAKRDLDLPQIYEAFARTTFTYIDSGQ